MKKSLIALALGAFALGAAEFVMMGILPQTAHALNVGIPVAGNFISSYAIGVCVGTLILVFGRKVSPKRLIIFCIALIIVGNLLSALSTSASMLIVSRFIAGLPHGAFFGTATLIAKSVAERGKEAKAVSMMVTGQTLANMLGVPAGSLLAEHLTWRMTFASLCAWAVVTLVLSLVWLPDIPAIKDAGIGGQFAFLRRRAPWLILGAVFFGNAGIFCWWSYVSPWLMKVGGYDSASIPTMMMLAGFGMVIGGLVGGNIADHWRHAGTASIGQILSALGLLLVFLIPGTTLTTAILTFWVSFGLFFVSSPQQILMVDAGKGGGELIGGAAVQVAFNLGNAIGSIIGGIALTTTSGNYHASALSGMPMTLLAVALLIIYSVRHETHTGALERMKLIHLPKVGSKPFNRG
ncbi:MFS transporter [Bifidobacterium aquikefiricola]|uniref:MFS transporter n=1 Tax=Bifidobacterium aquikefiricola TaxID=3059038 RepID=A0AB39U7A0_9BIFI